MMIDDEELRLLFQTESEEHLSSLDSGLLRLESTPDDRPNIEEMFRAAHSLKGSARMLGLSDIEMVSHRLEDTLSEVKKGRLTITPEMIDRLSVGLDALRDLSDAAVSGRRVVIDLTKTIKQLEGTVPLDKSQPAPAIESPPAPWTSPAPIPPQFSQSGRPLADFVAPLPPLPSLPPLPDIRPAAPPQEAPPPLPPLKVIQPEVVPETVTSAEIVEVEPAPTQDHNEPPGHTPEFRIQTMRVPPARLDALMTLASELTVTINRVNRGLAAFASIGELWEEWHKDVSSSGTRLSASKSEGRDSLRRQDEADRLAQLKTLWDELRGTLYEDATRLGFVAENLDEGIRNIRLLPLSSIFGLFPRPVRDLARSQEKEIQFHVEGAETPADKRILEELKDPLMHMIRNSIDHGIEMPWEREQAGKPRMATITLRARQTATNVVIELNDDGRGLDIEAIKRTAVRRRLRTAEELATMNPEDLALLIFAPGFSTSSLVTDVSGRGVGMDVVRTNVERLKGSIQVNSVPGEGCTFTIILPLTLATTRVLLAEVQGFTYGIPVEHVASLMRLGPESVFTIEGKSTFLYEGEAVQLVSLSALLEIKSNQRPDPLERMSPAGNPICVVLGFGHERLGVLVDTLLDEQEVMLKPLGPLLPRVRNVSAVTILGAGELSMILNVHDVIRSAQRSRHKLALTPIAATKDPATERRKRILLAEDSITTRTQEKRILEGAGYEVITAVDGADAFQKLALGEFDAVVSDVEMPNMTGLELTARIREDRKHEDLPIILVTSLASEEDRRRGAESGANAYITKGTFDQKALLETLGRLV